MTDPSNRYWPGDARTIEQWLRARMLAELASGTDARIDGLDRVRISVDATGTVIDHLLVDATGVKLTLHASGAAAPAPGGPAEPVVVARQDGMLRSARLVADPVKVQGLPVHLDVTLNELPFAWVTYDAEQTPGDPTSRNGVDEAETAGASPTGSFTASARVDDIGRMLNRILRARPAGSVRVRRIDVAIEDAGAARLQVRAAGTVRWKLLAARVRAEATVHITPDAVVTLERLRLTARNPLIALALRMLRSQTTEIEGQTHDLNADAGSIRIHDLRVTAGETLRVTGRIG